MTLPILVLNPDEASFDTIIRHDLEPEIYNLRQLNQFRNFISGYKKSFPVQIKLDTVNAIKAKVVLDSCRDLQFLAVNHHRALKWRNDLRLRG